MLYPFQHVCLAFGGSGTTGWMVPSALNSIRSMAVSRSVPLRLNTDGASLYPAEGVHNVSAHIIPIHIDGLSVSGI